MGWKALKEHFGIGHVVQVRGDVVCIGSTCISDLITVGFDGKIKATKLGPPFNNDDLDRYYEAISSDPKGVSELLAQEDRFERSITVYTYEEDRILELRCESANFEEWPIVTHCGRMMYENTFSTDREQVVAWAIRNAEAGVEWARESVGEAEKKLVEKREWLAREERILESLKGALAEKEQAE